MARGSIAPDWSVAQADLPTRRDQRCLSTEWVVDPDSWRTPDDPTNPFLPVAAEPGPVSDDDVHVALVTPWQRRGGVATYSERYACALEDNGARVTSIPIGATTSANPLAYVKLLDRVPEDADVIHVQFEAGLFGRLGVSGTGAPAFFLALDRQAVPAVVTLHEVHAAHPHQHTVADRVLRGRDTVLERLSLWAADATVVHTKAAADVLHDRHGDHDAVHRMLHPAEADADPVPANEAKRDLDLEVPVALTFGFVEEKKRCRALAERLGVADRVRFLGYVEDRDVPTIFSAADVVVLPYERVTQSGVVNEALAYERPVVASALPAFEELEAEFDCLLTYEHRDGLQDRLQRALRDKETRTRLTAQAREYVDAVSWDRFAERSLVIYASLVD